VHHEKFKDKVQSAGPRIFFIAGLSSGLAMLHKKSPAMAISMNGLAGILYSRPKSRNQNHR
jgi:hypothetical protein